ncbi:helix-hairpin-helix domain-containing protein [Polymorphobacter sp.]|uniref:helix-hairpin-helix domain-containing protein n=1 Tax=Polymorphobacter sp. TaxID=1909290 RepID=UPI003F70C28F
MSASTFEGDPLNKAAVDKVCTRCHQNGMFLTTPRSWIRWTDVFRTMSARGATGTDAELDRVVTFFLENLTIISVNASPANELSPVLGVTEAVADAIVIRRETRPFRDLDELAAFPGVDRATLERRRARIQF